MKNSCIVGWNFLIKNLVIFKRLPLRKKKQTEKVMLLEKYKRIAFERQLGA